MSRFIKKFFSGEQESFLLQEYGMQLSFRCVQFDERLAERITENGANGIQKEYFDFLHEISVLKESNYISLQQEMRLLKTYVHLYKISFPEIFIQDQYNTAGRDVKIPPLITLTIVQNALYYGNNTLEDYPLKIKVSNIRKRLLIDVVNKVNPYLTDQRGTDIMQYLETRLHNHFGEEHTLIVNGNSNTYRSHFSVNLE
ncbi:MAG TPA: hypothetical protein VK102_04945 [Sphingobacterium sp.]|nr:hypothetical protein [Sphingobacterium sp.]